MLSASSSLMRITPCSSSPFEDPMVAKARRKHHAAGQQAGHKARPYRPQKHPKTPPPKPPTPPGRLRDGATQPLPQPTAPKTSTFPPKPQRGGREGQNKGHRRAGAAPLWQDHRHSPPPGPAGRPHLTTPPPRSPPRSSASRRAPPLFEPQTASEAATP